MRYITLLRGDRRENIYDDDTDRIIFLEVLAKVVTDYNWLCHSYCLMDNHYHLIIKTLDSNLSKGMRQLNGVYTQATNRHHSRSGHLFQGRYKAILDDKDQYLLELARYVVLNPVKVKCMVRSIEDWPWSNYLAFIGHTKTQEWLTPEWVLSQFGRNNKLARENYKRFVLEGVGQKIDIWSSLNAQIYLGDDTFVSTMQNKIENTGSDWGVPKKQRRPIAMSLLQIEEQNVDRNSAIITAYDTGAYSQREIGEYFGLHPSSVSVIVRKASNS